MILDENTIAPDFSLVDQNGNLHQLSDYKGKNIVLYFYPKDDTSGCTTEACAFRDDYEEYKKAGVEILGVSPDPQKSHEKFATKYDLPFTLLADTDHSVCEKYGVWGKKQMYGKEYFGVLRTTFLINGEGKIVKVFKNVKPNGHSTQVLAALKE
ncbi:MAG: thioredoxin-dependent thiol peroxidase [Anaerolineaceae bacterium]|nr:thioredoxin-dependent thiol peroxidase [Anaerolineaceae bacterium]